MNKNQLCYHDKGTWRILCNRAGNWVLIMECEDCGKGFDKIFKWTEQDQLVAEQDSTFEVLDRISWPLKESSQIT